MVFLSVFACKKTEEKEPKIKKEPINQITDQEQLKEELAYALHKEYPIGDVRRYGIFPDSTYTFSHPVSKKSKMMTALDLAEKQNIELFFPKGYYNSSLLLDSRKNLKLRFDKAEFDLINMTRLKKGDEEPENIVFKGTVISYERLGLMHAKNIVMDSVLIKSDTVKSIRKMRSRGCHIYFGCEDIRINYLFVEDVGSDDKRYQHTHAALAVDGYKDNPKSLHIKKLHIQSTDRHGIYLTGSGHKIDEVIIDRFGIGSSENMSGMQDSGPLENTLFSAIWINRCYDSEIGKIVINAKNSDGYFTANFDEGDSLRPVKIKEMTIHNFDRTLPVYFADNTGVILEKLDKR